MYNERSVRVVMRENGGCITGLTEEDAKSLRDLAASFGHVPFLDWETPEAFLLDVHDRIGEALSRAVARRMR